jgi:hypothetical protein
MKNAADEAEVKKAGQREISEERQRLVDLKALLELPHGRRFIWWMLDAAGVYKSSFTGNSTTFFNEGRRDLGLQLLAKIAESSPESLVLMMQESKKREELHDER